jgi:hypothetical protein
MRQGADWTWPAYAAAVYALVSFYGTGGVGTLGGRLEEMARSGAGGAVAGRGGGVLKLAGAVLALTLVRPWGRVVPRRLLLVGPGPGALWWHVLVWDLWFLVWGAGGGRLAVRAGDLRASAAARAGGPGGGG